MYSFWKCLSGSAPFRNRFSAVHPDGTMKWNLTGNPGETFGSSGAVGSDGTVYVASSRDVCVEIGCAGGLDSTSRVYALRPDGTRQWQFSSNGSASCCGCNFYTSSSPIIGSNGIIYVGSYEGNLHAISSSGSPLWSFAAGGPICSSPSIDLDGTIYIGSNDGSLYAIR